MPTAHPSQADQHARPQPRVSITEAAEYLGVSTRTVRRYIAADMLPAYRVGNQLIRINPDDLIRLERRIPTGGDVA
jgi:excisionase family DNA binding protein